MEPPAYVDRYLRRRERGMVKEIMTPEGVPLRFTVAPLPGRVGAFAIDISFMIIAITVACIPGLLLMMSGVGTGFGAAWIGLSIFFITNFYFIFFEIRRQGSTPGKRTYGIKVIDRHGGALKAEAVFARNLTRLVEFFIPVMLVLSFSAVALDSAGLIVIFGAAWIFIVALLPAFNRERLRAGDLIAGTIVVLAPPEMLMADLVAEVAEVSEESRFEFTPEQLGVYGVYELQVLEDLLRQDGIAEEEALEVVCMKIRKKIGWDLTSFVDPRQFLNDFYASQRARLERGMMLGKRRESKQ